MCILISGNNWTLIIHSAFTTFLDPSESWKYDDLVGNQEWQVKVSLK